jgi:hypothetical protein
MDRLAGFPFVLVRVACDRCPARRGTYRLARLAEKFGAEMPLDELLRHITFDCRWQAHPTNRYARRVGNQYVPKCEARFIDLDPLRGPPDLPPALRPFAVVKGGKG